MSGGISENFVLINDNYITNEQGSKIHIDQFWKLLINARQKHAVISCNIDLPSRPTSSREIRLNNGLLQGHAYAVTLAAEIIIDDNKYRIIKLYNPWGKIIIFYLGYSISFNRIVSYFSRN